MSRGLSLDLISEDLLSHAASQFSSISLKCSDSTNNNKNLNDSHTSSYARLRRCSSLKSGKTPPSTPASKKIVRFADVMGLDLADVRTYLDEIPRVPRQAYDDLDIEDDEDECRSISQSEAPSSPSSSASSYKVTLVPLFTQPGGEANFFQLLNQNKVCLEKVMVTQYYDGHPIVSGTVRVRNEHFNKQVYVRYTTDQWRSYQDVLAKYIDNSCDGFSDKFSFVLYTQAWGLRPLQLVAMCFRYVTDGREYWDNHCGLNYTFQCQVTL